MMNRSPLSPTIVDGDIGDEAEEKEEEEELPLPAPPLMPSDKRRLDCRLRFPAPTSEPTSDKPKVFEGSEEA
jgi:hypothetical protein